MQDLLNRITFNKDVLCGKPLIRGLRISNEFKRSYKDTIHQIPKKRY
jgi:hypothetical protein